MSFNIFIPQNQMYVANVPISADTVRWSYTVPNGRRATLQYAKVRVFEAAATAFGAAYIRINLVSGTAAINNFLVVITLNAIGDRTQTLTGDIDLTAGDVLQCTSGNGGAGAILMECGAVIREYQ